MDFLERKESTQYVILTIYYRHILAAVHYNFNLHRETKKRSADGEERIKVSYPKFKNGEATVREVRVQPNFGEQAWFFFLLKLFLFLLHNLPWKQVKSE